MVIIILKKSFRYVPRKSHMIQSILEDISWKKYFNKDNKTIDYVGHYCFSIFIYEIHIWNTFVWYNICILIDYNYHTLVFAGV